MKPTPVVEITARKLACPNCNEPSFEIGHIREGQTFGPWYCDSCGEGSRGELRKGVFSLELAGEKNLAALVLLRHRKQTDLYVVVRGLSINDFTEENHRYLYEEHTCPTNFLGEPTRRVIEANDEDPHGIFEYVGRITNIIPSELDNRTREDELIDQLLRQEKVGRYAEEPTK